MGTRGGLRGIARLQLNISSFLRASQVYFHIRSRCSQIISTSPLYVAENVAHAKHTHTRLAAPNSIQLDAVSLNYTESVFCRRRLRVCGKNEGVKHERLLYLDFGAPRGTSRELLRESDSGLSSGETCLRGARERQTTTELINFQIRRRFQRGRGVLTGSSEGARRRGR